LPFSPVISFSAGITFKNTPKPSLLSSWVANSGLATHYSGSSPRPFIPGLPKPSVSTLGTHMSHAAHNYAGNHHGTILMAISQHFCNIAC